MTARLITPPATEPLTLAEAKLWLRVDGSDDDALIASLITTARETVEREARMRLITQGWRISLDTWPYDGVVDLTLGPVQSVSAVRVYAANGSAGIVPPSQYRVDLASVPARLWLTGITPQPEIVSGGIEIDVISGFGAAASDVPETLRHAVRLVLARLYEHRGDGPTDIAALPPAVASLLAPYRRARL